MADGEEEGEGEGGEKRLVDLRRSSLMASPQVKNSPANSLIRSHRYPRPDQPQEIVQDKWLRV